MRRKEDFPPFTRIKSFFMLTDPLEGTCLVGELSPSATYSNIFLLIDLELRCPPPPTITTTKTCFQGQALVCKGPHFTMNPFLLRSLVTWRFCVVHDRWGSGVWIEQRQTPGQTTKGVMHGQCLSPAAGPLSVEDIADGMTERPRNKPLWLHFRMATHCSFSHPQNKTFVL